VVELAGGPLELVGPAARSHTWGPWAPVAAPASPGDGERTFLRAGPVVIERVLTRDGWRTAAVTRSR